MGLLSRAIEKEKTASFDFSDELSRLYCSVLEMRESMDFPEFLFSRTVPFFQIQKGALLLKSPGDEYRLAAIQGYDHTTASRLRLSLSQLKSLRELNRDTYYITHGMETIEQNFSIREYTGMEHLTLLPLEYKGSVKALLLISSYASSHGPDEEQLKLFGEKISPLFESSRENLLKESIHSGETDLSAQIRGYCQKIKTPQNRIIFMKISFESLIQELCNSRDYITAERIRTNGLKLLTSFFGDKGKAFALIKNKALLVIRDDKNSVNINIVQHQIQAAFKTLYKNLTSPVNYNFETLIWHKNSLTPLLTTLLDHEIN